MEVIIPTHTKRKVSPTLHYQTFKFKVLKCSTKHPSPHSQSKPSQELSCCSVIWVQRYFWKSHHNGCPRRTNPVQICIGWWWWYRKNHIHEMLSDWWIWQVHSYLGCWGCIPKEDLFSSVYGIQLVRRTLVSWEMAIISKLNVPL